MASYSVWQVAGTYYEVCNCEAVCPCRRRQGSWPGGRSTYGVCDFALSWRITEGHAGDLRLAGLCAVLAGSYSDDEPGSPWRVVLYVDEKGTAEQQQALADIFLGHAGGETRRNFAAAIGQVYAVRSASIRLEHAPGHERMDVQGFVSAATARLAATAEPVSCGIPGHDRPGQEIVAECFRVAEDNLSWDVYGRCGFATGFAYHS